MKNAKKPFFILDSEPDFSLIFLEKADLPSEYSQKERIKISYFMEIVDSLWDGIMEIMGDSEFYVAMEGLSFSSNGNALIDISMATALLRKRIIDTVGVDKFYVFSPTSIKKFAVKGNAKKDELYDALINFREETETNLTNFANILETNKEEWVTPSKAVNKPIDDIVDATWITLYLMDTLKENHGTTNEIKGNLKKPSRGSLKNSK
jgi:hypothetical protein